jgi:hypothetical protein
MKRTAIVAAALLALPAFADSGRFFIASLVGWSEVPAVNTEAVGGFTARVIGGDAVQYTLEIKRLSSPIVQAHIHFAQSAVNGPIVVWLCGTPNTPGPAGTPTCPQEGVVTGVFRSANVLTAPSTQQLAAGELEELLRAMRSGAAYANVHTATSPGGEIRGQIFGF